MKYTLFASCLGLISACGPLYEDRESPILDLAASTVGLSGDTPAATPTISPEIANAQPGDLLLVTLTSREAVAAMTKAQVNGDVITWISPGAVTMTFDRGILIGTRGFNDDLMGVDAHMTRAAIDAGGGTVNRAHSFLDSEDRIITRQMHCTVTRIGTETLTTVEGPREAVKFEEACTGAQLIFTNKYWMQGDTMIRSSQAVSAGVGFIQADQL